MNEGTKPRRPLVPGPYDPPGIAAKAVALREAQRKSAPLPTYEEAQAQVKAPAVTDQGGRPIGGLGHQPEIFSARPFGPVGNIAGAIANVMANIGTIEKGGYNAFHKYHYARMEELLHAVTPLIGQSGLAVIQHEVEVKQIEGNRVAVTYEFSIFHKSGEFWPERPRFTGMSIARDSKGNWDDKAINKCHTNARKYFLLALFQVPAGDFEEADADANQRQEKAPVPGPKSQVEPQSAPAPREDIPGPPTKPAEMVGPQKIILGRDAGPEQWAGAYMQAIGKAKSKDELKEWDAFNGVALQALYDKYPDIYSQLIAATERRLDELERYPMPIDPTEAMSWIAEQLQTFKEYEAAEEFWNQTVAPREKFFDPVDWEMLMDEWRRTEQRLAPEPPEAEPPKATPGLA